MVRPMSHWSDRITVDSIYKKKLWLKFHNIKVNKKIKKIQKLKKKIQNLVLMKETPTKSTNKVDDKHGADLWTIK